MIVIVIKEFHALFGLLILCIAFDRMLCVRYIFFFNLNRRSCTGSVGFSGTQLKKNEWMK